MLKRSAFKSKQKPLKRTTPLKSRSETRIEQDKTKDTSDWDEDRAFYLHIWDNRLHYCSNEHCKKYLGDEPLSIFFDHILEKSMYERWRHEEKNIQLLCWECHDNKHMGNISEKMKELKDKLLEEYNEE